MKVAVLSLCRDRLDYTKHCFQSLHRFAGCDFDHFVMDNGSTDGTYEWLDNEFTDGRVEAWAHSPTNVGIHRAMNELLANVEGYDVVVKVDNDCELTVPGTLRAVADIAYASPRSMVGPVVQGLRGPAGIVAEVRFPVEFAGLFGRNDRAVYRIGRTSMVGGIMQPIPPGWRYDETLPPWGGDDDALSAQADWCGQLLDFPVNHYRTTDQQHVDYPEYFAQRVAAGGPA